MRKRLWQMALVVGAILSLVVVIVILLQVILSPYIHGGPAKVVSINAGPYPLNVTLYNDPANAGYSLPFAIRTTSGTSDRLVYDVSAVPAPGTIGSIVHASMNTGTMTAGGIPGNVSITVRGNWSLHIVVNGPNGQGEANVPFTATAPPAIPAWFAWLIGFIPLYGIVLFLLSQRRHNQNEPTHPIVHDASTVEHVVTRLGH